MKWYKAFKQYSICPCCNHSMLEPTQVQCYGTSEPIHIKLRPSRAK